MAGCDRRIGCLDMRTAAGWSRAPDRPSRRRTHGHGGTPGKRSPGSPGRGSSPRVGTSPHLPPAGRCRGLLEEDRRPPGDDGAGHYGRAPRVVRLTAPVGMTNRRRMRVRDTDALGNVRKRKRPHQLAEEMPVVGCAILITRRLDMDRGKSTLGVQNRVGGSEHGRYPDVEQADAGGADAAQVPCVRSPNEQVPPPTGG